MTTRNPASILYDGSANPVGVIFDGTIYRLQVESHSIAVDSTGGLVTDGFVLEFSKQISSSGPTFFLLIDLDNDGGSGPYPHVNTGHIIVGAFTAHIDKSSSGAQWEARLGVILTIDGTSAAVAFIQAGSVEASNTAQFHADSRASNYPLVASLRVSSGELVDFFTNSNETETSLNTGITIEDVGGNLVTPGVGDMIIKVERGSGSGTANIAYATRYRTEP